MKVIAIVDATDLNAREWLGHRTQLIRALEKLSEIRDVSLIVVRSDDKERVDKEVASYGSISTPVEVIAPSATDSDLCVFADEHYKSTGEEPTVYLFVSPCFPFMPQGKIESILHSVLSDDGKVAVAAINPNHPLSKPTLLPHCMAMAAEMLSHRSPLDSVIAVPVGPIEAVYSGSSDGFRVANALMIMGEA